MMSAIVSRRLFTACCLSVGIVSALAIPQAQTMSVTPQAALGALLDADRQFSTMSAKGTVVQGLTPIFSADVVMPAPNGKLAKGIAEVMAVLNANPDNVSGRVEWSPIRGGISADGEQGFTFGFMTLHKADHMSVPLKYMSYWVKGRDGWRVVAYKRVRRPEGDVSLAMMPGALPEAMVAPVAITSAVRQSLVDAEQAFSDSAQNIGLGPAFAAFGLPDAVNFGGPANANYLVGAEAIARMGGGGQPATGSSVSWSCETPIVASSGDLGVSIGFIRSNAPATDGAQPPSPFFTIWRKVNGAWKYIAE